MQAVMALTIRLPDLLIFPGGWQSILTWEKCSSVHFSDDRCHSVWPLSDVTYFLLEQEHYELYYISSFRDIRRLRTCQYHMLNC